MSDEQERPRICIVGDDGVVTSAAIIALLHDPRIAASVRVPGEPLTEFRQSGGQITDVLGDIGRREWSGSINVQFNDEAAVLRMLEALPPPTLEPDTVLMTAAAYEAFHGLKRKPMPKPPVQLPMTRQQRRYLARKGRTND